MSTDYHITVLGSGVIGLTCAIRLAEQGARVSVVSKDFGPGLASDQCGGLWEPFHIEPAELVQPWSFATYKQLAIDAEQPDVTGVREWDHIQLLGPGQEARRDKLPYWGETVGMQILKPNDPRLQGYIPQGYCGAWHYKTYVADMAVYMPYLQRWCKRLGVKFWQQQVASMAEAVAMARAQAGSQGGWCNVAVVNCTGVGARQLCNDARVRPGRGVVVRAKRPATIKAVCDDLGDGTDEGRPTYIIPKGDLITLGGLYHSDCYVASKQTQVPTTRLDNWDTTFTQEEAHDIVARCCRMTPALRGAEIVGIWAGLRPVRDTLRFEEEVIEETRIVHCYGHGGAGVTVSWGCADDVAKIFRVSIDAT